MILRNPLTSPVRGARQNGRAPSRAFMRAQKAIYAGSIRIPQDAGYRGYAEDIQLEQQLIRKLLYSPTGLSTFFLEFVQNWFAFSKKPSVLIFGYVVLLLLFIFPYEARGSRDILLVVPRRDGECNGYENP